MASVAAASDDSEEDAAASRSRVQDWTASLRPGLPLDHGENHDPIARLYLVTAELYCGILAALRRHLGKSDALYRSIERGYSSLVLWSRDHDVASGNLDAALEHSQGLRHLALRLLTNVCGAVLDRLIPRTGLEISPQVRTSQKKARTAVEVALAILPSDDTDVEESGEDADSAPSISDSLARVASDIHTIVGALVGLGPLFEEPIPDRAEHEQPAQLNIATPVAPLVRLIQLIFPACEDETARGIAQAALETSRRILEEAVAPAPGDQVGQANTTSGPPQKASTLVGTIFHDSALGTSLGTGSLYAETVRSYEGGSDRPVNIQLPQMPKEGVDGTPFLCQTCNRTVLPRSEAEWKRHLMSDARPYMCIEPSCPIKFLPFPNKSTWTAHIASHYADRPGFQVHCPICGISYTAGGGDIRTIATHLAHHLEPIAAELIIDGVTFTRMDEESVDGAASNAPGASSGKGVEGSPRSNRGLVEPLCPTDDAEYPNSLVNPLFSLGSPLNGYSFANPLGDKLCEALPPQHTIPRATTDSYPPGPSNHGTGYVPHPFPPASPVLEAGRRCSACGLVCRTRSDLKKHLARHTRPFECIIPGCTRTRGFSTANDLARHTRSRHPELESWSGPVYKCTLGSCALGKKIWHREDNFRQHLLRKHKHQAVESVHEFVYTDPTAQNPPSPKEATARATPVAINNSAKDLGTENAKHLLQPGPQNMPLALPKNDSLDSRYINRMAWDPIGPSLSLSALGSTMPQGSTAPGNATSSADNALGLGCPTTPPNMILPGPPRYIADTDRVERTESTTLASGPRDDRTGI